MKFIKFKIQLGLFTLLTICTLNAFSQKSIEIISTAQVIPVLKGIENNQLVRVMVYVPAGTETPVKKITAKLNPDGIKAIEKIEVYFTGMEPLFSGKNKLLSINPATVNMGFDVNLNLKPGMH